MTYQHKHPPFPLLQPHEEECNSSCLLNLGPLHVLITTWQPLHGQRNKHCEEGSSLLMKQKTKKHALSLTISNSNITNISGYKPVALKKHLTRVTLYTVHEQHRSKENRWHSNFYPHMKFRIKDKTNKSKSLSLYKWS